MEDDHQFCKKCGARVGEPRHPWQSREKNVALAVIGSAFISGVGQMYVDRTLRGLGFLFLTFLIIGIYMAVVFAGGMDVSSLGPRSEWYRVVILIGVAIKVWSIIDAYKLANEFNKKLKETGNPPW